MKMNKKYQGIFPAFYACYDDEGRVSTQRAEAFTAYLIEKGVDGLYVGGSSGTAHSVTYKIIDADMACVGSAKGQLLALKALLENDAQKAKQILAEVKPVMESKEAYFAFVDKLDMDKRTVTYQENGTVTLDFTN